MSRSNAIAPAFSLYLDLLRFTAAVAVFLDHLTPTPSQPSIRATGGLARVGNYGELAVAIFFVLSGYVISYVTSTRETTVQSYAVSRISRLYSVVVPALVLTFAFDTLGHACGRSSTPSRRSSGSSPASPATCPACSS